MAGWPEVSLAEITTKIGSGSTPRGGSETYLDRRITFALVRSQNVFDRRFDRGGLAFISDEQAAGLRGVILESNDILLNITGDGITFGRACKVPEDVRPACVNQHVSIVRVDPSKADPGYVLSYLTHPDVKRYIESFNAGGSRRAITKGHIESFRLPLPPLTEQRRMASILGTIDDKIELNSRMNETLEAMAGALFKSWFVDFDPVRAKMAGRDPGLPKSIADLFPDRLVESELGEIPDGWTLQFIGDLSEQVAMGPFGSSIKVETFVPDGIPVISGQHLRGLLLEDSEFNFVTEQHAGRLKRSNVKRGDVVFTHAGSIGQVAYIPKTSRYERYVISQRQFYVRCDETKLSPLFLVCYFQTPEGQHRLLANTSSTGVPSISQPVTYLRQLKLVVPPMRILAAFDSFVHALFEKIVANKNNSKALRAARDALVPKLISGQLRVCEAERIVAGGSKERNAICV